MNKIRTALWATLIASSALLAGCEKPKGMESTQNGYRGLAMGQTKNPRIVGPVLEAQVLPAPIPALAAVEGGPLAKAVFKNVQVLGDVSAAEFTRTMLALTAWVSPKEGCIHCHTSTDDLANDGKYTKVVARRMLQMTLHINTQWRSHVAQTGVTCYTCHRGQPIPQNTWFTAPEPRQAGGAAADGGGQNLASAVAGYTALGVDPLTPYLLRDTAIRTAGVTALPTGNTAGIRATEGTFGLMMYMSSALGVNCTFCHNTRGLGEWAESPLQRTTAFHGIRMARDLNNAFMLPLTASFPKDRLGPTGDVAKIGCASCHQGVSKPLRGAPLLRDHPVLGPPDMFKAMVQASAG